MASCRSWAIFCSSVTCGGAWARRSAKVPGMLIDMVSTPPWRVIVGIAPCERPFIAAVWTYELLSTRGADPLGGYPGLL